MDGMTNEQMQIILKMVLMIIEGSEDKEAALKKIKELLKEEKD
jgi:hypothetical protein